MSKKAVSCGLGLLGIVLFIGFTAFLCKVSVDASRESTLKMTLGSEVAALAAYLAEGSRGLRAAALAAKKAYALEAMPCWNAGNDSRSIYLMDTMMAIQQGYPMLRYVYFSYQLPGSSAWGDCGCQASANMGPPYSCYYVNSNNSMIFSNSANVSQVSTVKPFIDSSEEVYTQTIRGLTAANVNGYWMQPDSWIDTLYNTTTRVMSFTLPISFDSVSGNCTLAATTDLDLGSGSLNIKSFGTLGELVLLDGRGSGFLIDGSIESFYTSAPTSTASPRVNDLISTFRSINSNNFLVNTSFSQNGFNYQSATIDNTFVLINRAPIQTRAVVASSALKSTFDGITLAAYSAFTGLSLYFQNIGASNFQFAVNNPWLRRSGSWFATSQALLSAVFPKIAYIYADYQYTSSVNSSTLWGEAGTYFTGNVSTGPQGLVTDYTSYITSDNSTEYSFTNANLSGVLSAAPSTYNANSPWIQYARQLTPANAGGKWQLPWWAPNDKKVYESFQIPVSFDVGGNCIMAVGADVDITFLSGFLQQYKASAASLLAIIDTRGLNGLLGSPIVISSATATYNLTEIFTASTVPDTTLGNIITRAAASAPGGNFTTQLTSFSFYDAPTNSVVNVVRVPDAQLINWAVVEVVPVQNLQQLFSSASNVANTFNELFTPAQRTSIFVFAGFVILVMLIDHIIILTIKTAEDKGQWETAMNNAA